VDPQASIPDVLGMTKEKALESLNAAGFKNVSVILEDSNKDKDKVFSQTPVSGTLYDKSLDIIIKISKGIRVPDVITMTKGDAVTKLEELGFVVEVSPADVAATAKVKSQIPAADTYLNYGSKVTIVVKE
jgi:beta-lactam-binding protein with PASTA domain